MGIKGRHALFVILVSVTVAAGVLASQARSERTEPLGTGNVTIFPDSPGLDNCIPFGTGDPNPDFWGAAVRRLRLQGRSFVRPRSEYKGHPRV